MDRARRRRLLPPVGFRLVRWLSTSVPPPICQLRLQVPVLLRLLLRRGMRLSACFGLYFGAFVYIFIFALIADNCRGQLHQSVSACCGRDGARSWVYYITCTRYTPSLASPTPSSSQPCLRCIGSPTHHLSGSIVATTSGRAHISFWGFRVRPSVSRASPSIAAYSKNSNVMRIFMKYLLAFRDYELFVCPVLHIFQLCNCDCYVCSF